MPLKTRGRNLPGLNNWISRSSIGRTSLIAGATATFGLLLGIFAASPSQWLQSLTAWLNVLSVVFFKLWPVILTAMGAALGLLCGRYVWPDRARMIAERPNVITEFEFSNVLQEIVSKELITKIDILSYTNETVGDVLKYEYRNKEGLKIRVLSRNWLDERADEDSYNKRLIGSKTRKWHKAEMIERIAKTPWHNAGSREQRFYWGMHPFLKIIFVESADYQIAFLSIYDWQEWPSEGGSPFKGANPVGVLLDSRLRNDDAMLAHMKSQYTFLWDYQSAAADAVKSSPYKSVFEQDR